MNLMRESIFVGAFRSFCTAFAAILGIALSIGLVLFGIGIIAGPNYFPPKAEPLIAADANGDRDLLPGSSPALLRIDIHGVIGMGDLTSDKLEEILLDSRDDFLANNRVKGILLHFDTPGGVATDADAIYRMLMDYKAKYKVPIFAYVDGMCASGGMYVASAADKIYATDSSVIGSVGVLLGPNFNFSDLMTKWGIASKTFTEGKDKDMLNPFRPWVPGEDQSIQNAIAAMYQRFVAVVSQARPLLTKEKLIQDYGAHIYISEEAAKLGYIDVPNTDYSHAVADLATAAGVHEKYQVVALQIPRPLFAPFAESMFSSKEIKHKLDLGPTYLPELGGKFLYLYLPH
ncbi:MAG: S49 family peptidase [Verrucomicrobia bacterium]|nr:S49 family peptidase [Verrucomicrobiota bacterium]